MTPNSRLARIAVTLVTLALACGAVVAQDATARRGFSITITEPENQSVVFGKTKIAAEVKIDDPNLIDRVEFIVGDEVVFVDHEAPWECYFDFGEEPRSWIVRAVAYHKEGVSVSDASITRRLRFSTFEQVNRVILWVTPTDKDGNLVTDLERDDFRVKEQGAEQKVIDFYREDRPITLAILLDTSASMQDGKIDEVHEAAGAFVDTLRDQDRALIIDFNDSAYLIQDLTSDHDALRKSIESTEPIGGTALYDALHAAYRRIGSIEGRKVIVMLSDGDDSASRLSFDRVLEEARTNNTMIFAIGLSIDGGPQRRDVVKELAESTGGRYFNVKKAGQLKGTYDRIAEELRTQYYLTYSTPITTWDGQWVKIEVDSLRDDLHVRARKGYFAVRGTSD